MFLLKVLQSSIDAATITQTATAYTQHQQTFTALQLLQQIEGVGLTVNVVTDGNGTIHLLQSMRVEQDMNLERQYKLQEQR